MLYVCYRCWKFIKCGAIHHIPPILHERLGIDFRKAFHPKCHKLIEQEAFEELHKGDKNQTNTPVNAYGTGARP